MIIPAGLAFELELLTQALDVPGTDLAQTLTRLAADAHTAVDSYLGLSVTITANQPPFDLTLLNEGTRREHIRASLLIPLSTAAGDGPASVALILYAATPGAFIDLAADLSFLTGRTLAEFPLDEHRALAANSTTPGLASASVINQALGVLVGRGATLEQARRDLRQHAAAAGIALLAAATVILAALTPTEPDPS